MDQQIRKMFEKAINNYIASVIISNSTDKEKITKVKIRPVLLKGEICYQVTEFVKNQVFHRNYQREELLNMLPIWFEGLFRQAEIITGTGKATILISKKGKVTINDKLDRPTKLDSNLINGSTQTPMEETLMHNKKKKYILEEGTPLPFLIDLGVMTKDGNIVKAKSDKFRQINRFLEYIEDVLPSLDKNKELTILDFGCGKSYLTFALYYYLKQLKGYDINVVGLDLKEDVIQHCNSLSHKYGYDNLQFLQGDIASYQGKEQVDMVVTLHACDTATDFALSKAVVWGAKVILSVPCCQHEINKQIQCDILKPVLKYGIVKERMSALITDALRAELLETWGYKVQLLEFIDMEHTPKNILIRAVKRNATPDKSEKSDNELKDCMDFLQVSPSLQRLLHEIKEGK